MLTLIITLLLIVLIYDELETSGSPLKPNWRDETLPLKVRQLALLEETASFYNLNNRSLAINGDCMYNGENGHRCAIGRIVDEETLSELTENEGIDYGNFDILPDNLKSLDKRFLASLQYFHDSEKNWDDRGLSSKGKERFNAFKQSFNLN